MSSWSRSTTRFTSTNVTAITRIAPCTTTQVACADRGEDQLAQPRPREDRLDQHRAAEQEADLQPGRRQDRVRWRSSRRGRAPGGCAGPWPAGSSTKSAVGLDDAGPRHPRGDADRDEGAGEHRHHQVAERTRPWPLVQAALPDGGSQFSSAENTMISRIASQNDGTLNPVIAAVDTGGRASLPRNDSPTTVPSHDAEDEPERRGDGGQDDGVAPRLAEQRGHDAPALRRVPEVAPQRRRRASQRSASAAAVQAQLVASSFAVSWRASGPSDDPAAGSPGRTSSAGTRGSNAEQRRDRHGRAGAGSCAVMALALPPRSW